MSNPPQSPSAVCGVSAGDGRPPVARSGWPGVVGILCVAGLTQWATFHWDALVLEGVGRHAVGWSRWLAGRISYWGDWYGVLVVGLCGWWWARRRAHPSLQKLWLTMGVCAALGGAGANVVRALSGRARPNAPCPPGWYGPSEGLRLSKGARAFQSFPSAHTAVVAGFCAPVGWAALRARRRRRALVGMTLAVGGTVAMGWARVWVGAHHLSDVWAAGLLGWGVAWVWAGRDVRVPGSESELTRPVGRETGAVSGVEH